jgi:hypothetical protein
MNVAITVTLVNLPPLANVLLVELTELIHLIVLVTMDSSKIKPLNVNFVTSNVPPVPPELTVQHVLVTESMPQHVIVQ